MTIRPALQPVAGPRRPATGPASPASWTTWAAGSRPQLLTPAECEQIAGLYDDDQRFRSTMDMGRHRFGEGEYRYFQRPCPEPVEQLKQALYPRLLPIARDWYGQARPAAPWPDTLDEWLDMCHAAGQTRSTADPAALPGRATGTRCTATCTATWCSRCRW